MHKCYKCNLDKDLQDFSKDSKRKNNISNMCKQCKSEYDKNKYTSKLNKSDPKKEKIRIEMDNLLYSLKKKGCSCCDESVEKCLIFCAYNPNSINDLRKFYNSRDIEQFKDGIKLLNVFCFNCKVKRGVKELDKLR